MGRALAMLVVCWVLVLARAGGPVRPAAAAADEASSPQVDPVDMPACNLEGSPMGNLAIVRTWSFDVVARRDPRTGQARRQRDNPRPQHVWLVDLRRAVVSAELPKDVSWVAWRQDERALACFIGGSSGERRVPSDLQVLIREVAGANATRLPLSQVASAGTPSWSPDGRQLVFLATVPGGPPALYTVPVDGSAAPQEQVRHMSWWCWNADGTRLLVELPARQTPEGYTPAHPEGVEIITRGALADTGHWTWSPDHRALAAVWRDHERLTSSVLVLDRTQRLLMRADGLSESAGYVLWSPDSRRLLVPDVPAEPLTHSSAARTETRPGGYRLLDLRTRRDTRLGRECLHAGLAWIRWEGKPQFVFPSEDRSRLLITEGLDAPARQLAHLEPDGSLVFDLKPRRPAGR